MVLGGEGLLTFHTRAGGSTCCQVSAVSVSLRVLVRSWRRTDKLVQVLLDEGLLTPEELEAAIATQIGSSRVSFLGGREIWVKGVLDLGVDPRWDAFALSVYA